MNISRNIAFVSINQFNPALIDGACRSLLARLLFLKSQGNHVSIINYVTQDVPYLLFQNSIAEGISYNKLEGALVKTDFHGVSYYERFIPYDRGELANPVILKQIMQDLASQMLDYALTADSICIPLLAVSLLNIPGAHFFNSLRNVEKFPRSYIFRNILNKQKIFCNSQYLQGKIRDILGLSATIWHSFLESDSYVFRQNINRTGTIGLSASGGRDKGTDIFAAISNIMPEYTFKLAGLWDFINPPIPIPQNLHFIGFVSDMRQFYEDIDLLLVPSLVSESFPRVIMEAAVNSIPIIASDVGGIPEALGNNGILIKCDKNGDPVFIAKKYVKVIRRLMEDDTLYSECQKKSYALGEAYRTMQQQESGQIYAQFMQHVEFR